MTGTTQTLDTTYVAGGYDTDQIKRGVEIFGRLPIAQAACLKDKPLHYAARRILDEHPSHDELRPLLTEMAGTARQDRLEAVAAIYSEYTEPGSVIRR